MGQAHSLADSLPDVDSVHMQVVRHTKVLSEINSLTYEEFKTCLGNLNALSRKCIDPNGKQLVFLVKNGTDTSLLWKATVKIACVKVNPETRQIDSYKFLNLKQFLCVFKTFQAHLESLVSSEIQREQRRDSQSTPEDEEPSSTSLSSQLHTLPSQFTTSMFMSALGKSSESGGSGLSSPSVSSCVHNDHVDECSICLDRQTEVILPCTHSFCTPCIEQWNVNNKTCPICCETLESTDETWVMSNLPEVEEINEEICAGFMNLAKQQ
ncbi:RING finger protein 141-like isoform X1 [Haematobia irritans]|uniref:RING finger protein 141-like isoform X1 n=1 Tax=Haematobia irritans TaxID=7368 RepID=UPI003F505A33